MGSDVLEYYVEYEPCGSDQGVYNGIWKVDRVRGEFECVRGRTDLKGTLAQGEDAIVAIQRLLPDKALHPSRRALARMQIAPGEYFHRIARPVGGWPMPQIVNWDDHELLIRSQMGGQLDWLLGELRAICQTIHPLPENLQVYGHAIRNLLILACTEVEAAWKGVLVSNGYEPRDKKGNSRDLTTNDYSKLLPVMKLADYSARFSPYPWLDALQPFKRWNPANASKSLDWYQAYNSTKHDRERSFKEATLGRAFEAVSACAIMLHAQFGNLAGSGADTSIVIVGRPAWTWGEYYVPANQVGSNALPVGVNYPFS